MASLGLKVYHSGGGDFSPRIEYNAKAGRMHVVNRREGADGAFANDKIDVTMSRPMFAIDIGSIEIGWIAFPAGAAPDAVLVPFGNEMPARPSSKHKAGFQVKVWNGTEPESREFKSTAGVVVDAIEALWDTLTATGEAVQGMIPVVQLVNVQPVAASRGTNYAPVFDLVTWIDRDERVFGPRTVAPPGTEAPAPIAAATVPPVQATLAAPPRWQAPRAPQWAAATPQPVANDGWGAPTRVAS